MAFSGVADETSLERQKRLVVEGALSGVEDTVDTEAIVDAARQAHAIEQVDYDSVSHALSIHVIGSPSVHWMFLTETNRLAIDIDGAVNLVAGKPIEVAAGGTVESIRTSQFKLEPEMVSRVVLQMSGPVSVDLNDTELGILKFTFAAESVLDDETDASLPEAEEPSKQIDVIVAAIRDELDSQLVRPETDRAQLVALFSDTREDLAERHEELRAEGESKAYPTQLGYLVLLADHEALLGGHLGEIAGELELAVIRENAVTAELELILNSDFEESDLRTELNSLLAVNQEEGLLAAGRFEQILKIASDEQQVALGAIDDLALKVAEAPSIEETLIDEESFVVAVATEEEIEPEFIGTEEPNSDDAESEAVIEVAEVVIADIEPLVVDEAVSETTEAHTTFEVADADVIDDSVSRIDDLMELALAEIPADELVAMEDGNDTIVAGEAKITPPVVNDTEDPLVALDELASEISRLRSHPTARDTSEEPAELQIFAMNLATNTTVTPDHLTAIDEPLEQVDLAPMELGASQVGLIADAAAEEKDEAEKEDDLGNAKSLLDSDGTANDSALKPDDVEIRPNTDAEASDIGNLPPVSVEAPEAPDALAVGGPEVGSPTFDTPQSAQQVTETGPNTRVDAEVTDSTAFESPVTTAEASPVPVENAGTEESDSGLVAVRASQDSNIRETPQVMAQATPGQSQVITADMMNTPQSPPDYDGDPMDQPVSIEFRDERLRNIIGLLAQKAGVNIIGSGILADKTVSANMNDIPLRQAMDMLLRLEDFGMVEEEGVYRIVPYEVALQLRRVTRMVPLRNAQADEVEKTLTAVTTGAAVDERVLVAANKTANVIVLSGPLDRVAELEQLIYNLDIAEPTLPTVTEAIRLNYAEPEEVKAIVETLLTADGEQQIGKVESDLRGRSVVVTDLPVVVEQIKQLVKQVDFPVQQVSIDSMVVDVTLTDDTATGVDWFVNLLRRTNTNGELVGNLSALQAASDFGGGGALPGILQNPIVPNGAGVLSFGILSSDFDIQGIISAEVRNNNAEILANPHLVTLENQPADIEIIQEFPYRELTQTEGGGQIASTEFKNIGTTLQVTPRVTADEDILVSIFVEQSVIVGFSQGDNVPITNNRRATTNVRTDDQQTIFIGGLRRLDDALNVRKVPVLGDIPIISPLFRTTTSNKQNTDLLIFVTCNVLGERAPDLNGKHQQEFDRLGSKPEVPDSQREVLRTWAKPNEMRDPMWKWRRSN
jgi:type II secretory pathway component GspD/PulD (secretin)